MFRIPTEFLILGAAQYIDHIQNRTKNSSSQKSAFAMKSEKENRFEEKLFSHLKIVSRKILLNYKRENKFSFLSVAHRILRVDVDVGVDRPQQNDDANQWEMSLSFFLSLSLSVFILRSCNN